MSENSQSKFIRSIVRGLSNSIVLWILNKKPSCGYEIVKEIKRLTNHKLPTSVVYPILYGLEEDKFIKGNWKKRGRRYAKYYSLTERGRNLLNSVRELFRRPLKDVITELIHEKEWKGG